MGRRDCQTVVGIELEFRSVTADAADYLSVCLGPFRNHDIPRAHYKKVVSNNKQGCVTNIYDMGSPSSGKNPRASRSSAAARRCGCTVGLVDFDGIRSSPSGACICLGIDQADLYISG